MGFWPTPPSWGSVMVWEGVMDQIVSSGGPLVLDGGLATRLEADGRGLRGGLWSARLLADAPELIRQAHRDFFEAGADVAISAGYQASVEGFTSRGIDRADAVRLVARSVELALAERDAFGAGLVAAGVGPYGAVLADGGEYTGDYDLDEEIGTAHV